MRDRGEFMLFETLCGGAILRGRFVPFVPCHVCGKSLDDPEHEELVEGPRSHRYRPDRDAYKAAMHAIWGEAR